MNLPGSSDELETSGYYAGLSKRAARVSRAVLGSAIAVVLLGAALHAHGHSKAKQWSEAYAFVDYGMSREGVTAIMGARGEPRPCGAELSVDRHAVTGATCVSVLSYAPFPLAQKWSFTFDAGDRVVAKVFWAFEE